MYNRLRVEHGAYGSGSTFYPTRRWQRSVFERICAASRLSSMMQSSLIERTSLEMVIDHYCGGMCSARPPLRHWQQP